MPETYTATSAATGTWTEAEIPPTARLLDPLAQQHRQSPFGDRRLSCAIAA
ncbi:Uncharacterised protein [Raoultella terrigena]|uniref:Uncharacterized protein n=1 Tax=Raoultella terrigena TaxID=577 RepID=A0A4U9D6X8_RAOTE|nr:Uncharacterised protein [Raoultella terrigena]